MKRLIMLLITDSPFWFTIMGTLGIEPHRTGLNCTKDLGSTFMLSPMTTDVSSRNSIQFYCYFKSFKMQWKILVRNTYWVKLYFSIWRFVRYRTVRRRPCCWLQICIRVGTKQNHIENLHLGAFVRYGCFNSRSLWTRKRKHRACWFDTRKSF